jgi:hypothetical protein
MVLRSQRTYPLALHSATRRAINAGIVSAYDFQGDPNNAYAGGNGAPHVGSRVYGKNGTPPLVAVNADINGRDPSVGRTALTPYTGTHIGPLGFGSADGKGAFTIHRRFRTPSSHTLTTTSRTSVIYRDGIGSKLMLYATEAANYITFKWDVAGIIIPTNTLSAGVDFQVPYNTIVDIHLVRTGNTINYYLNGKLVASASVPSLLTYNTDWAGSSASNGVISGNPSDIILIDETYWNRALNATEVSQHTADPYAGYVNSAVVPDGVTITNPLPGTAVNSEGFVISGQYAGTTEPTGIEYRFNGGSWADLQLDPTDGWFTGTTAEVTSATGLLEVRFKNATTIIGSVSNILATPPAPTVTLVSQPLPDGQSQQFNLTTTRATTVQITLVAADGSTTTEGPVSFPVVAGVVNANFPAVKAGNYTVIIQAIGAGGTATIAGTAFSILGANGGGFVTNSVTVTSPPDIYSVASGLSINGGR